MVKSFRYFKKSDNSSSQSAIDQAQDRRPHFKYSVYMQSKDSKWLNRNLNNSSEEEPEPIEEDIRD